MRAGTIVVLVVLVLILVASGTYAYQGLTSPGDPMPSSAWVAMAAGILFSVVVGAGLMGLLLYSSRRGFDDPPHLDR